MANDRNWGGRRPGAGRPPRGWKIVPHRPRYRIDDHDGVRIALKVRRDVGLGATVRKAVQITVHKWNTEGHREPISELAFDQKRLEIRLRYRGYWPEQISKPMHLFLVRLVARIHRMLGRTGRVFVERYQVLSPPWEPAHELLRERMKAGLLFLPKKAASAAFGMALAGTAVAFRNGRNPMDPFGERGARGSPRRR